MARHPLWLGICLALLPSATGAQSLGSFSWQLAPFCNVITVNVTQTGTTYTLDGYDNQCGGSTRAVVLGMAVPNPTGTIALGFAIVTPPAGTPVHVTTNIDLASLGGSWSDDQGHTGTFVFTPSGLGAGSPRPPALKGVGDNTVTSSTIVDGAVSGADINDAEVQKRVTSTCPSGQLMTAVNQDGTVSCEAVTSTSGGDITGVAPGPGLAGGGATGDVTLAADFAQVQARVATPCPAGQFLRGVSMAGTPGCEPVLIAQNATQLGGVAAGQYVLTNDGRLSDARDPLPGSVSYIRNSAVQQSANFNVSGAGTVGGTLNAGAVFTSAYGFGATPRVFGKYGVNNLFAGALAGSAEGGTQNTFFGDSAGRDSLGNQNTFVGFAAGQLTTSGSDNVFVGSRAGQQNRTGTGNSVVGMSAADALASGDRNTIVGKDALGNLTSGSQNIAIGFAAGSPLVNGDDNIYIGGPTPDGTESGTIRIGAGGFQGRFFASGIRSVTTGVNNAVAVVIDSAGQLGTVSSTRRSKFDIGDLSPQVSGALQHLRPVQFRYRQAFADGTTPLQYGLIAEEVQEVLPALVAVDDEGQPATVKYHVLPSLLLAEVQRLEHERQTQAAVATAQERRIAELERALSALETAMSRFAGPPPM